MMIYLSGRFDVIIPQVICQNCFSCIKALSLQAVIENGYWPGSLEMISTIFSVELLEFWSCLQKAQPSTAESAFIRVLEESSEYYNRVCKFVYSVKCSTFAISIVIGREIGRWFQTIAPFVVHKNLIYEELVL